jgi:magnesium transporter
MIRETMNLDTARFLLENRDWKGLRNALDRMPAPEIADLMEECSRGDRVLLFRAVPRARAAEVFAYLDPAQEENLLLELTDGEARRVLADMTPDDRTALLEELPDEMIRRLLSLLTPEDLGEARELLGYPEESVGRLMTPDYVALRGGWSVKEALAFIRNEATRSETVNYLYVTGEEGQLEGAVELRRLIVAPDDATVVSLVNGLPGHLRVTDDREEAVRVMQRYDVNVLPVLSHEGILLGIVTADDVLDVVEEEVTEDFHRMAPVGLMKTSLREAGISMLWRARVGWLLVLVFMNIFSGAGIAFFEDTLAATISLAFFLPLLIDSGGNAGSQAATLMVRALAPGTFA